ncbi:hypothetical protein L249_3109, partial [Ophiocordyceps polyrhachis-furcata BCC 54312]
MMSSPGNISANVSAEGPTPDDVDDAAAEIPSADLDLSAERLEDGGDGGPGLDGGVGPSALWDGGPAAVGDDDDAAADDDQVAPAALGDDDDAAADDDQVAPVALGDDDDAAADDDQVAPVALGDDDDAAADDDQVAPVALGDDDDAAADDDQVAPVALGDDDDAAADDDQLDPALPPDQGGVPVPADLSYGPNPLIPGLDPEDEEYVLYRNGVATHYHPSGNVMGFSPRAEYNVRPPNQYFFGPPSSGGVFQHPEGGAPIRRPEVEFMDLPTEVKAIIFSFLPLHDRLRLRQTSGELRDIMIERYPNDKPDLQYLSILVRDKPLHFRCNECVSLHRYIGSFDPRRGRWEIKRNTCREMSSGLAMCFNAPHKYAISHMHVHFALKWLRRQDFTQLARYHQIMQDRKFEFATGTTVQFFPRIVNNHFMMRTRWEKVNLHYIENGCVAMCKHICYRGFFEMGVGDLDAAEVNHVCNWRDNTRRPDSERGKEDSFIDIEAWTDLGPEEPNNTIWRAASTSGSLCPRHRGGAICARYGGDPQIARAPDFLPYVSMSVAVDGVGCWWRFQCGRLNIVF